MEFVYFTLERMHKCSTKTNPSVSYYRWIYHPTSTPPLIYYISTNLHYNNRRNIVMNYDTCIKQDFLCMSSVLLWVRVVYPYENCPTVEKRKKLRDNFLSKLFLPSYTLNIYVGSESEIPLASAVRLYIFIMDIYQYLANNHATHC